MPRPWVLAAGFAFASVLHPPLAAALVLDFDFTTLSGSNPLGVEESAGGVTAHGFVIEGGTYHDARLWKRNERHDHGVGICSEGKDACIHGGGDVNEISNQMNLEVLRLTLPTGKKWTGLWVSSLDAGGSGSDETGTLFWSSLEKPDLSRLSATSFTFKHSDLGATDQGNLFAVPGFPPRFDASATYLFFRAGVNPDGNDNDYLVWGGDLGVVPEPTGMLMIAAGLIAMGSITLGRLRLL